MHRPKIHARDDLDRAVGGVVGVGCIGGVDVDVVLEYPALCRMHSDRCDLGEYPRGDHGECWAGGVFE